MENRNFNLVERIVLLLKQYFMSISNLFFPLDNNRVFVFIPSRVKNSVNTLRVFRNQTLNNL
jgi:hypothetical protein